MPPPGEGQRPGQAHLEGASEHLMYVGAWGASNLVGGAATVLIAPTGGARAYGLQSSLWGAVNLSIATVGLSRSPRAPSTAAEARAADARLARLLAVNLGLNVGYVAVGTGLIVGAPSEAGSRAVWRGHGTAVVVQGVALLLLDARAYAAARRRQRTEPTVAVGPSPGGLRLTVRL